MSTNYRNWGTKNSLNSNGQNGPREDYNDVKEIK